MKRAKKKGMIFKVDIDKAYDSLSWDFLGSILDQMNFPLKWRSWISVILNSGRASVLVNGSPTHEFDCSRGLRQGDPLSPFLFILAMEALSCMVKKASSFGLFHGIRRSPNGRPLTHFLYADDVVLLGDWSKMNALNLIRILRCFYLVSGLKINLAKCSIFGVGVGSDEVGEMANVFRCKAGRIPFKHLGLQIGANMNLLKSWKPVLQTFQNRLSIWKAKTLSVRGRVTLIKSVVNALPTYYFTLYKAPESVINALDRIRRVFFWGGSEEKAKMNWVAWQGAVWDWGHCETQI
ncbi:putative RNA-directed DNA polymerase [Helianthus anomalus]